MTEVRNKDGSESAKLKDGPKVEAKKPSEDYRKKKGGKEDTKLEALLAFRDALPEEEQGKLFSVRYSRLPSLSRYLG